MALTPVVGAAQEGDLQCSEEMTQTYCAVRAGMLEANMPTDLVRMLDEANDDTLMEVEAALQGEASDMQKQNRVEAILENME
jgi:hypothetical protein